MQTEGRAPITSSRAHRARRLFIIFATVIFALDLITKNWAVSYLQFREPIRVVGDFLKLTFATNPGAAFNFATDATLILSSLKLCVAAFLIYYMRKVTNSQWAMALGALLGGVPVFNIADSAIVCSGIFMTWLAMRNIQPIRHDENNNVHNEDKK